MIILVFAECSIKSSETPSSNLQQAFGSNEFEVSGRGVGLKNDLLYLEKAANPMCFS